jgi:PAS domain S-box-containing protein
MTTAATRADAARLGHPQESPSPDLPTLRRRLIDPVMIWLALPLVGTHLLALRHLGAGPGADWSLLARFGCLAVVLGLILYRDRLAYGLKARVFLLCLWGIIGLSVLAMGPVANSKAYFILLVLLGMLFLDRWSAWLNVALGGVIFGLIGIGAVSGRLTFPTDLHAQAYSALSWLHTALGLAVYSGICAYIALRLIDSLNASVTALCERGEQQRHAQAELARTLAEQHAIFSNAAAGIALLDADGHLVQVNPTFAALLGSAPGVLAGTAMAALLAADADRDALPSWGTGPGTGLGAGTAWTGDLQLRRRDGRTFWAHASLSRPQPAPADAGAVLVLVDIDRRKRAEQALAAAKHEAEAATRAKSRFLAAVSHELRTPLHAILGALSLLDTDSQAPDGHTRRQLLDSMQTSGRRLLAMIEDLLTLARDDPGPALDLHPEPMSPPAVLHAAAAAVAPLARVKGLVLSVHVASGVPDCILADPRRLTQIVDNLLANAIKYTTAGEVVLAARATAPAAATAAPGPAQPRIRLQIDVQDTGPGLPEYIQREVFNAFVQGHADQNSRGSGLGLAIARTLARRMGGDIRLASTPGAGSTFTLVLDGVPVCAADTAMARHLPAPPRPLLTPALLAALWRALGEPAEADEPDGDADGNDPMLAERATRITALAHAWGHSGLAAWSAAQEQGLRSAKPAARARAAQELAAVVLVPPPPAQLAALRTAAQSGHVAALERWCADLGAVPRHAAFARHVAQLADAFEHGRIAALAAAFLGEEPA